MSGQVTCGAASFGNTSRPISSRTSPAFRAEIAATGDLDLVRALEWSEAVNRSIGEIVHDVPPFPFVREALGSLAEATRAALSEQGFGILDVAGLTACLQQLGEAAHRGKVR